MGDVEFACGHTYESDDQTEDYRPQYESRVPLMVIPHQGQTQEHEDDTITCSTETHQCRYFAIKLI